MLAPLLALENPLVPQPSQPKSEEASAEASEAPAAPAADIPPLSGTAKGIAYQLFEAFGTLPTARVGGQLRDLSETDKPQLARLGIRMGVESLYMAEMLKPASIKLRAVLWSVHNSSFPEGGPPPEGRVSINAVDGVADDYWLITGYRRLGTKVMRVDMVERVSALVRAAARAGQFKMTDDMLSLAGVSRDEMKAMILDLGCRLVTEEPSEDPEKPAIPVFERVRRKKQGQGDQKPHAKGKRHGGPKKGPAKGPHKGKPSGAPKQKQADPNSPFAVLAALKK